MNFKMPSIIIIFTIRYCINNMSSVHIFWFCKKKKKKKNIKTSHFSFLWLLWLHVQDIKPFNFFCRLTVSKLNEDSGMYYIIWHLFDLMETSSLNLGKMEFCPVWRLKQSNSTILEKEEKLIFHFLLCSYFNFEET